MSYMFGDGTSHQLLVLSYLQLSGEIQMELLDVEWYLWRDAIHIEFTFQVAGHTYEDTHVAADLIW